MAYIHIADEDAVDIKGESTVRTCHSDLLLHSALLNLTRRTTQNRKVISNAIGQPLSIQHSVCSVGGHVVFEPAVCITVVADQTNRRGTQRVVYEFCLDVHIVIILRTIESIDPCIQCIHLKQESAVFRFDIGNRIIPGLQNYPTRQRRVKFVGKELRKGSLRRLERRSRRRGIGDGDRRWKRRCCWEERCQRRCCRGLAGSDQDEASQEKKCFFH